MKAGDILLVKTKYEPISWIIRKVTKSNYNHVCIAFNNKLLINIRAKGMEITPLKKYKNNLIYEYKLLRMKGITKEEINKLLANLMLKNFKRSYLTWLIKGIEFVIMKKTFKNTCSGLIAQAFQSVGYYFRLDKEPYEITPEDINKRRLMKEVTEEL